MATTKKARLNIVDFLLIALALLSVVAIFLRPKVIEQIGKLSANDTAIVTFVADEVTAAQLEKMAEGDLLTYEGKAFGELTAFTSTPRETLQLVDPEESAERAYFRKVTVPEQNTVKGQLRISGSEKENGFYVEGNTYVGVGTLLQLEADSYTIIVQITGIS